MVKIKNFYLALIDKEKRNAAESAVYFILVLLSFVYWLIIRTRNFLYDHGLLKITVLKAKVVSVGNVTWSGTGKTSLVSILYQALAGDLRVAAVTKGYAGDEYRLLKEKLENVLDAKNRVDLLFRTQSDFDLFLLDDGFQYRKLGRDLDIVMIKKEDLFCPRFLIPASPFREPLSALKRARIVLVTYCPAKYLAAAREKVRRVNNKLEVFCADYEPDRLLDLRGDQVSFTDLRDKPVGVLTAIGYPRGFLQTLAKAGIKAREVAIYPDHYQFSAGEIADLEKMFLAKGIKDVIITAKDFHHMDFSEAELDYFLFVPEFRIFDQEKLIGEVKECISGRA